MSRHSPVEEDEPIQFSENRKVAMPLTVLISVIVLTASTVFGYASLRTTDEKHGGDIAAIQLTISDHEKRLREQENLSARVDENLRAIREMLEKRQASQPSRQ